MCQTMVIARQGRLPSPRLLDHHRMAGLRRDPRPT